MYKNLHIHELRRVLCLMGHRKGKYLFNLIIAVLSVTALVVVNSLTMKKIINGVIYGQAELLTQALYLAFTGITLVCFVSPVTSYRATRYGKETICELRTTCFDHVMQLPKQYFQKSSSGEILSRLTNDLNKFSSIYDGEFYVVLESLAIGSVSMIFTIVLDWRLALVSLLLGLATFTVNTLYAAPINHISRQVQSLVGQATQRFLDLIVGNRVIKLFNIDQIIVNKFVQENCKLMQENVRLTRKEAEKDGVNYLLDGAYFIGILGVGGLFVSRGWADLGTVVAVLSLRGAVGDLFTKFGSCLADLQKSLAGVNRVFEVIDEPTEGFAVSTSTVQQDLSALRHAAGHGVKYAVTGQDEQVLLTFENVHFSHDGKKNALNGLNLQVRRKQVTALVGYSGSGKSTLMKLLLGLYTPQKGKIVLHGVVKGMVDYGAESDRAMNADHTVTTNPTLDLWRSQFAYVAQDAYLFDTTIEENIRYGKPEATQEEIIAAAKRANAHEFIQNLPSGYETRVGENSTKLSGGQRQRIAIARALIKDAPILLLDEATSALDSEAEVLVQDAIAQLMQGRTTIVIAHRLSTIQHADTIYVIDSGQIVDQGRHEELLARKGVYQHLYDLRFLG